MVIKTATMQETILAACDQIHDQYFGTDGPSSVVGEQAMRIIGQPGLTTRADAPILQAIAKGAYDRAANAFPELLPQREGFYALIGIEFIGQSGNAPSPASSDDWPAHDPAQPPLFAA